MKKLIARVDINAKCPTYTLDQIRARERDFKEWELRNDMIAEVVVHCCDRGFLSLGVEYESKAQGVGYGYRSEGNIGLMILELAKVAGVQYETGDILKNMKGRPIRVLFKFDVGGFAAACTYIGHFMEDKFVKMSELVKVGILEDEQ